MIIFVPYTLCNLCSLLYHYRPTSRVDVRPFPALNSWRVLVLYMACRELGCTRSTGLCYQYTPQAVPPGPEGLGSRDSMPQSHRVRSPVIHMLMIMLRTDSSCLLSSVFFSRSITSCVHTGASLGIRPLSPAHPPRFLPSFRLGQMPATADTAETPHVVLSAMPMVCLSCFASSVTGLLP